MDHFQTSLKGQFLIAVPELSDRNFFRSVVLMIQHDDQGAMGVILNRPANVTVGEIWTRLFEIDCDCKDPIHVGGPVEGPLMVLHRQPSLAEMDVIPGVFVSMNGEHLKEIIAGNLQPFKLFSGYSGWGSGQLEQEMEAGGWLILPADEAAVFGTPENLWKRVCEEFGTQIVRSQLGKSIPIPDDPSLN